MIKIEGLEQMYASWMRIQSKKFSFFALPIFKTDDDKVMQYVDTNSLLIDDITGKDLCVLSLKHGRVPRSGDVKFLREAKEFHRYFQDKEIDESFVDQHLEHFCHSDIPFYNILMKAFVKDFNVQNMDLPCIIIFTNLASHEVFKIKLNNSYEETKEIFRWLSDNTEIFKDSPDRLNKLQKQYEKEFGKSTKSEKMNLAFSVVELIIRASNLALHKTGLS